ncbi:hypothetical protein FSP39_023331 [Pinctada imbricata]|uniref:General transcription factor IIE subunit 1 n=1 Tax=Pinctada imbricata TaxID=66713 RepID=A0AA88YCM8_PINIB|nr:hypothetical protein FSP39_023331 [Pinctada imbricata]
MEPEVLTEVPQTLKRLIRLITRGFYGMEHAIIIDLLVRNPCMKEDDMVEILQFDRKQMRAMINTLKTEKFLKTRMRVETDAEGKATRHNYYFINYLVFVNVVRYKLDHVRRKIELEERDNTSRASFRCPSCEKTFTDLEVNDLFDFMSQTFRCTHCESEVEEDESASSAKDSRTLLAKFNEKMQPIYDLLKECDDIKLAPELMEPEPTDIRHTSRSHSNKTSNAEREEAWSKKRGAEYNMKDTSITISMDTEDTNKAEDVKEQPIWMLESTVDGAVDDSRMSGLSESTTTSKAETFSKADVNEISTLLYIHEKKGSGAGAIPGQNEEESSSDSEDETSRKSATLGRDVEEMESEDEEDAVPMVTVNGKKLSYHDVTSDMVSQMTPREKDEYIRIGQEMYQNMYE